MSEAHSIDSVTAYRCGFSQMMGPGSELFKAGFTKEESCPLHSPEVKSYVDELGKFRTSVGVTAKKADALNSATFTGAMQKLMDKAKVHMGEGKPLLARKVIMAWAMCVVCMDFWQRAETIGTIKLSDVLVEASVLNKQYFGDLAWLIDLSGKGKTDRMSKEEVSQDPAKRVVYTAFTMTGNVLMCPSLAITVAVLLQSVELHVAASVCELYGGGYSRNSPFLEAAKKDYPTSPDVAAEVARRLGLSRLGLQVPPWLCGGDRKIVGGALVGASEHILALLPSSHAGAAKRVIAFADLKKRNFIAELLAGRSSTAVGGGGGGGGSASSFPTRGASSTFRGAASSAAAARGGGGGARSMRGRSAASAAPSSASRGAKLGGFSGPWRCWRPMEMLCADRRGPRP